MKVFMMPQATHALKTAAEVIDKLDADLTALGKGRNLSNVPGGFEGGPFQEQLRMIAKTTDVDTTELYELLRLVAYHRTPLGEMFIDLVPYDVQKRVYDALGKNQWCKKKEDDAIVCRICGQVLAP